MRVGNIMYRELDIDDMVRMGIPKRYWNVTIGGISSLSNAGVDSPLSITQKYIKNISGMYERGGGLILWGTNGTGKTSMAVVIAKEYRRRGHPVLYVEASKLKGIWASRDMFDEDESWKDRISNVDVLVLDDFGKGIMDSTGFGATIFDELVRTRNANKRVTMITTNLSPRGRKWVNELEIKESTQQTIQECFIPVIFVGDNRRETINKSLYEALNA